MDEIFTVGEGEEQHCFTLKFEITFFFPKLGVTCLDHNSLQKNPDERNLFGDLRGFEGVKDRHEN